jgi:aspartate racemase
MHETGTQIAAEAHAKGIGQCLFLERRVVSRCVLTKQIGERMKTIGMLGGMSWESTTSYYKLINAGVKARLGGLHSAKIFMASVDFHELEHLMRESDWDAVSAVLSDAAQRVEAAGADFLIICTNTMHKVAPRVEAAISIPVLHIADATAKQLAADGIERVGLLGTRFTMAHDFYKGRITRRYGIDVMVPDNRSQTIIDDIIFKELCLGKINAQSRRHYLDIIRQLQQQGSQAVILGCTEIGLLVKSEDTQVPLYDTTQIHAASAVEMAVAQRGN